MCDIYLTNKLQTYYIYIDSPGTSGRQADHGTVSRKRQSFTAFDKVGRQGSHAKPNSVT